MKLDRRSLAFGFFVAVVATTLGCSVVVQNLEETNDAGTEHTIIVNVQAPAPWTVTFQIIDGPNQGVTTGGGDCNPCSGPSPGGQAQWTYESNGDPGTDTIQVCMQFLQTEICTVDGTHAIKHWRQVAFGFAPDLTPPVPTWTPSPTPTRSATAVPSATPNLQDVGAVRPPNTGDGGVSSDDSATGLLVAIAVGGLFVSALVLRRLRHT